MNIIDLHCDTISALVFQKEKQAETLYQNTLHVDLQKMKQSNYLLQNFAMFVDKKNSLDPFLDALAMIDRFYEEIEKNSDTIAVAKSYRDIIRNHEQGKISAMITLEEGGILNGKLSNLRTLYRLGARMITFTWNYPNQLGFPNNYCCKNSLDLTIPDTYHGLTPFGIEVIEEAERIGMMLDVSHLNDAGFMDVAKYTKKPFLASHSNARAICNHVRNLSDDFIRILSNRGGIIGINFYPNFLTKVPANCENPGTIDAIIEHIKHIEKIGGIDCISLGSDFDGIEGHAELPDCSYMYRLIDALHSAGFKEDAIEKICYKNALRFYRELL